MGAKLYLFYLGLFIIFLGYNRIMVQWYDILQPRTKPHVSNTNLTMQHDYQNDINIFMSPQLNNQYHDENINIVLSCDVEQRPGLYSLLNSILMHLKSNSTIYIHLLVETTIDSFIIEQELNLLFDKEIAKSMLKFEIKAFDKYRKFYKSLKEFMRTPDDDHAQHCYSVMTYARIYLSEIFINLEKALFLDTDMIVQNDVTKLFEYDTTEIIFWCVLHPHGGNTLQYSVNNNTNALKYTNSLKAYNDNIMTFNAGLYLYNLTYWRQNNMTEKCENIFLYNKKLKENWINQGDQSVLQLLFLQMGIYYNKIGHLNVKWNTGGFGWSKVGDFYFKDETAPVLANYSVINGSYILHWNGRHKPWLKNSAYNSRLFLKYLPQKFNQETIYNFNKDWLSYNDTPQFNGYDWYIIQNKTLLDSMRTNQNVLQYIQSYGNNLDVSDIVSWKPLTTNTNCVSTTHFDSIQIENVVLNTEQKSISIYIINNNLNGTKNNYNRRWLELFETSQYVFCSFSDGTSIISHSIVFYDWNNSNNLAVVKCKVPSDLISYVSSATEYSKFLLSIVSPSYIESVEIIETTSIQEIPVCLKYMNATINDRKLPFVKPSVSVMYNIDDIHVFLSCDGHERIALYTLMNSIIIHYNNSTGRRLYLHILVERNSKLFVKEINVLFDISKFEYEIKAFQNHESYEFLTKYFKSVQDIKINGNHTYLFKHMNFARFYFTEIFDLDLNIITKALYLDVDMILQADIQLLYDYNVNNTIPIMVPHVSGGNCSLDRFDFFTENLRINKTHQKILNISSKMVKNSKGFYAGIYLYDLRHWVENRLTSKYEYYLNLNYKYHGKLWNIGTQPLINLLYIHGTVGKILNTKWHLMGLGWLKNISESVLDSAYVLHWNGPQKPWAKDGKYKQRWLKYLPKGMREWNFADNGWDINIYDDSVSNSDEVKVFEIGVAKTGTTSLGIALEILGYKTADWNETLALEYQKTKNTTNIVLASQYFDAFRDGPWHTIDFRIWYYKYPNAKFILLEREDESWLKSYELWFSPKYNINTVSFKLDHLWIDNRTKKRNQLLKYKHGRYQDVIQFFNNNNQSHKLLIMNISKGLSWKPLCKFLNRSIPKIPYPTSHNSSQLMNQNKMRVADTNESNYGGNLYIFQEFEWLNLTNQTSDIECNKVVCDDNCLQQMVKLCKRCCSGLTDNRYFIGSYNDTHYNSTKDNDQTICDLLLMISNKSILSFGDSLARNIHYSFVRDVFEQSMYVCGHGYITNITIDLFKNISEKLFISERPSFLKWQHYHISFDYYDNLHMNNQDYPPEKHNFKYSNMFVWRIIPSHVVNFIDEFNKKYSKFNYNQKSINYSKLNLSNWDDKNINSISFHYFMHVIETGQYDSVLINLGMHYKINEGESNHYKYILNFIANILQNDMSMNNLERNKVHIWRMTTPSHFHTTWRERTNDTNCVTTATAKDQSNTNAFEYEIFLNSNYSIPIIDYNNVLSSRGDLHLDEESDCVHWCASNKLWKPFWKLLTQIYKDQSW